MIYANNWIKQENSKQSLDVDAPDTISSKDIAETISTLNKLLEDLKHINIPVNKDLFSKKLSKLIKSTTFASNGTYDSFLSNLTYTPTGPVPFPKNVDLDDKGNLSKTVKVHTLDDLPF